MDVQFTLVYESMPTSYLVHIYRLAGCGIVWCYGHLVAWQHRHVLINLLFKGIVTWYLVQRSLGATAVYGITCWLKHQRHMHVLIT